MSDGMTEYMNKERALKEQKHREKLIRIVEAIDKVKWIVAQNILDAIDKKK